MCHLSNGTGVDCSCLNYFLLGGVLFFSVNVFVRKGGFFKMYVLLKVKLIIITWDVY